MDDSFTDNEFSLKRFVDFHAGNKYFKDSLTEVTGFPMKEWSTTITSGICGSWILVNALSLIVNDTY